MKLSLVAKYKLRCKMGNQINILLKMRRPCNQESGGKQYIIINNDNCLSGTDNNSSFKCVIYEKKIKS